MKFDFLTDMFEQGGDDNKSFGFVSQGATFKGLIDKGLTEGKNIESIEHKDKNTLLTKFISKITKEANLVDDNKAISIIDPDRVREKAIDNRCDEKDEAFNQISDSVDNITQNKKAFASFQVSGETKSDLAHSVITGDFPDNFNKEQGQKRLSIIITGNPDRPLKDSLSSMFDEDIDVKKTSFLTRENFTKAVIYHEVAHGLDQKIKGDKQDLDTRYEEEALADVFSSLCMINKEKNPEFAKAFADIRAISYFNNVKDAGNLENAEFAMSYCTAPLIDKAVEFAKKEKIGEKELSFGEIMKYSNKIVSENKLSSNELKKDAKEILENKEKTNNEMSKRAFEGRERLLKKNVETAKKQEKSSYSDFDIWAIGFYKKIQKFGKDNLLYLIAGEKNSVRKEKTPNGAVDFLYEAQMRPRAVIEDAILYEEYVKKIKAKDKRVQKEMSPKKALEAFIKTYDKKLKVCAKSFDAFEKQDAKTANKEFDKLMAYENQLFGYAKTIKKDKELYSAIRRDKHLEKIIGYKSKEVVPLWQMAYNAGLENDFFDMKTPRKYIDQDRKNYKNSVVKLQKLFAKDAGLSDRKQNKEISELFSKKRSSR